MSIKIGSYMWTYSTYGDDWERDLMLVKVEDIVIVDGVTRVDYYWDGGIHGAQLKDIREFNGELPDFERKN
jgi:hypothetical protein